MGQLVWCMTTNGAVLTEQRDDKSWHLVTPSSETGRAVAAARRASLDALRRQAANIQREVDAVARRREEIKKQLEDDRLPDRTYKALRHELDFSGEIDFGIKSNRLRRAEAEIRELEELVRKDEAAAAAQMPPPSPIAVPPPRVAAVAQAAPPATDRQSDGNGKRAGRKPREEASDAEHRANGSR